MSVKITPSPQSAVCRGDGTNKVVAEAHVLLLVYCVLVWEGKLSAKGLVSVFDSIPVLTDTSHVRNEFWNPEIKRPYHFLSESVCLSVCLCAFLPWCVYYAYAISVHSLSDDLPLIRVVGNTALLIITHPSSPTLWLPEVCLQKGAVGCRVPLEAFRLQSVVFFLLPLLLFLSCFSHTHTRLVSNRLGISSEQDRLTTSFT